MESKRAQRFILGAFTLLAVALAGCGGPPAPDPALSATPDAPATSAAGVSAETSAVETTPSPAATEVPSTPQAAATAAPTLPLPERFYLVGEASAELQILAAPGPSGSILVVTLNGKVPSPDGLRCLNGGQVRVHGSRYPAARKSDGFTVSANGFHPSTPSFRIEVQAGVVAQGRLAGTVQVTTAGCDTGPVRWTGGLVTPDEFAAAILRFTSADVLDLYGLSRPDGAATTDLSRVLPLTEGPPLPQAALRVAPPYTGPLFDAHVHLGQAIAPASSTGDTLLRMMDRDGISWALGFYAAGPLPASFDRDSRIALGARGRVVPLLQPPSSAVTTYLENFPLSPTLEAGLGQYLRPAGAFAGIGEVPLYDKPLLPVTFQSPQMQAIFSAVGAARGIVMIHPRDRRSPPPTTLAEIEDVLVRYPQITFELHGSDDIFDLVEPLMERYPNLFFSYDFASWTSGLVFWSDASRQGGSAEQFLAEVQRLGEDRFVDAVLRRLLPRINRRADRVMWGTDRFIAWHFDAAASAKMVAISRLLIARLPPEQQEAYAYRNAMRAFGPFLDSR